MKKLFLYTVLLFSGLLLISSCKKEEIGGTATEKMAGQWYVTVTCVDEDDNVVYTDDDFFGLGHFQLDTYNEASNSSTKMWINDNGTFWDFKVKANVDLNSLTFQADNAQNVSYDCKVNITNGKVLYGAATTPSGMPADSVVFNVTFSDDTYPADYGFASYRVAGFRYTGFTNDD